MYVNIAVDLLLQPPARIHKKSYIHAFMIVLFVQGSVGHGKEVFL